MNSSKIKTGYEEWIDKPIRSKSGEVDFGVLWRLAGANFPLWRVSWIANTGELYAKDETTDRYVVLGHYETREQVEELMTGYAKRQRALTDWALVLRMREAGERLGLT